MINLIKCCYCVVFVAVVAVVERNKGLRFNPLSANFTKWSNTLKQFVDKLPTNCLSVFDHFVGLVLKGLMVFILLFHCFSSF